jgi:hypothetical protein
MDTGEKNLRTLLASMAPTLDDTEYVFLPVPRGFDVQSTPLMRFQEAEGDTLVMSKEAAAREGLPSERLFRRLVLSVHSDLTAVGFTSAIAARLTRHGISANVIAAYYHDHVFVAAKDADRALAALEALSAES